MRRSWWDLGEWAGTNGEDLALYAIECPFCGEKGNFSREARFTKKKPNGSKELHFDTYKCGSCAGFVQIFWSASEHSLHHNGMHDYLQQPRPIHITKVPDSWPQNVQRFWTQANRSIQGENLDAAAVMIRSGLQAALRSEQSRGLSLKQEIENLAKVGALPPVMKEWAHELRLLGNESAHPEDGSNPPRRDDVLMRSSS